MTVNNHSNRVVDAVGYYNSRQCHTVHRGTPSAFLSIKEKLQEAKNKGIDVLMQTTELGNMDSVRLTIDYVGDRWCRGYEEKRYYGEIIRIPYTISYTEIYVMGQNENPNKSRVQLFFRGENPFG